MGRLPLPAGALIFRTHAPPAAGFRDLRAARRFPCYLAVMRKFTAPRAQAAGIPAADTMGRGMTFHLEPAVTLPWLVRLRWSFLAGQVIVLAIVHWWFETALNPVAIGIEVGIMGISNLVLTIVRVRQRWSRSQVIGAVMVLDTGLLTLLLMGSGGSANPFTVLYLVHIALSAIVLSARWTTVIAVLSLAGFGLLFVGASGDMMMHHGGAMFGHHLQAMWAAFAVAASLIAFFVGRVARAIASQREQIAQLRETGERNERLASITRLAAGAAHELGSPLATISVAAHEAKRHVVDPAAQAAVVADLELIALEVERCQDILGRMSARDLARADAAQTVAELADAVRDELGEEPAARLELQIHDPDLVVTGPRDQLVQSTVALIKNALEATRERVIVRLGRAGASKLEIVVQDHGTGVAHDVLERIGTPFFTTKGAGRGLGLGVFLARSFCESRGGTLTIRSEPGQGTRAVIQLPVESSAGERQA